MIHSKENKNSNDRQRRDTEMIANISNKSTEDNNKMNEKKIPEKIINMAFGRRRQRE